MNNSFLAWYLFLVFFLFSCTAIEIKEDIFSKKGKFSLASNSEYFSGIINVSDVEKRIQFNLDSLSKEFKISFTDEEIETKEDIFSKKGKFSLASNSEYFSGIINVSDVEKRIQFNLDSLSKDFKISFKDEEIKTNFKYENIIKESDFKLFLKWFFFKCTNIECQNFTLQNLKLKKHLSNKSGLIIQGNYQKFRLSLKLNDI